MKAKKFKNYAAIQLCWVPHKYYINSYECTLRTLSALKLCVVTDMYQIIHKILINNAAYLSLNLN